MNLFSTALICWIVVFVSMTWPPVYKANHEQIDCYFNNVQTAMSRNYVRLVEMLPQAIRGYVYKPKQD